MRVVVSALILLALAIVIGCDNDDNTVDPIPKFHYVYPVFHLKIDNGYRTFGVENVQLTTTPDIGWLGPVYTDENGFVGTLASGTFITDIDTTYDGDEMVVETTSVVFGFSPSQTYTFDFTRSEPYIWLDSFRAVYAVTIDSQWLLLSADTVRVTKTRDMAEPLDTVLYKVQQNPPPTPVPDELIEQELLYGWWFDTAFVVTDSAATDPFPPDSFTYDTLLWGFWYRIDTTFLPPDPEIWCDSVDTVVTESLFITPEADTFVVVDTEYTFSACHPGMDSLQTKRYQYWGWGTIANNGQRIPSYDTTIHFMYPDTTKGLIISSQGISMFTWEILPDSSDTISDTTGVDVYFIQNGDTTMLNNLTVDLTMPPVEVFPSYRFIFKQQSP